MNKSLAYLSGIIGSYGISIMTFLEQINYVGAATAIAGALLTLAMAYDVYMAARLKKEDMLLKRFERLRAEQKTTDNNEATQQ